MKHNIGYSILVLLPFLLMTFPSLSEESISQAKVQKKTSGAKASNRKNVTQQITPSNNIDYVYDNFGRLTQIKNGTQILLEYQYDDAGNRTQVVKNI